MLKFAVFFLFALYSTLAFAIKAEAKVEAKTEATKAEKAEAKKDNVVIVIPTDNSDSGDVSEDEEVVSTEDSEDNSETIPVESADVESAEPVKPAEKKTVSPDVQKKMQAISKLSNLINTMKTLKATKDNSDSAENSGDSPIELDPKENAPITASKKKETLAKLAKLFTALKSLKQRQEQEKKDPQGPSNKTMMNLLGLLKKAGQDRKQGLSKDQIKQNLLTGLFGTNSTPEDPAGVKADGERIKKQVAAYAEKHQLSPENSEKLTQKAVMMGEMDKVRRVKQLAAIVSYLKGKQQQKDGKAAPEDQAITEAGTAKILDFLKMLKAKSDQKVGQQSLVQEDNADSNTESSDSSDKVVEEPAKDVDVESEKVKVEVPVVVPEVPVEATEEKVDVPEQVVAETQ